MWEGCAASEGTCGAASGEEETEFELASRTVRSKRRVLLRGKSKVVLLGQAEEGGTGEREEERRDREQGEERAGTGP